MSDIEKEVMDIVEEAKAPGTFNILDVLKGTARPKDNVEVYLDEETAYEAANLKIKLSQTDSQDSEYAVIEKKLDALVKKLNESKYTFVISGITEGRREEIYSQVEEKFPIEYEEIVNPFTNEKTKEEKENKERDRLFTSLLWVEQISKIISPDGAEQTNLTLKDVSALRATLPIAASGFINQAIEKVRAATAMFMISVDEDFLAKS